MAPIEPEDEWESSMEGLAETRLEKNSENSEIG